ncbi:GNAT family N-acetyltransferase [Micromonospora sp. NPDC050397]|uniref:GNAT family N-acetyltransferase n=1 Tax=Micromonospora sp. NPDC050397 TaxID=3364279 RepID=UPI00384D4216
MFDALVRGLQERATRAMPAEQVKEIDGWQLRHAPGCSWWVGTVLPHGFADQEELLLRVVEAEEFYAGHGETPRFQLTPGVCPDELDRILADRGYWWQSPISLQVASVEQVVARTPQGSLRVRLDEQPTRAWFDAWHAVKGHGGDTRAEWEMLGRIEGSAAYACAISGVDVVAIGRTVVDSGWAGVFGMATMAEARGRGAARSVLAALAEWAGTRRVDGMYLQVECDNTRALRLYERMGFTEVCQYHYRLPQTIDDLPATRVGSQGFTSQKAPILNLPRPQDIAITDPTCT